MKTQPRLAWAALAGLVLLSAAAPRVHADETYATLIAAHAGAVVRVNFALSVQMSRRGQSQEGEVSGSATGIVLDAVGLVAIPSAALQPRPRLPGRTRRPGRGGVPGMEMKATPISLRVVFPGDTKEYDAVLGATDSRLGLSYLRIRDLAGKAIQAADLGRPATPAVGVRAYCLSRLGQGFDYAPFVAELRLAAHVTKPREMWLLHGTSIPVGQPVRNAKGEVLGFAVEQGGVRGRAARPFLVPLDDVASSIEKAAKEAAKVLDELEAAEAEAESDEHAEGEAGDEDEPEDEPERESPDAP